MGKIFDWLSNIRPRQLLALAGVSAILVFIIMYLALTIFFKPDIKDLDNTNVEETKEPEIKMRTVVIAARNIEPKTMIISRLLETAEFPENTIPADAITDINEVVNKPARERIFKGDIITQSKFYRNAAMAGFVGSIPPDCRAVSINVNDTTGVSGFAKPGDYVDLILVEKTDKIVTSRLLMQNVLLLSINQDMGVKGNSEDEENESSINPETKAIENPAIATVALRPAEILELVAATKLGEIYLMLRPLVPQSDYITGAEYTMQSLKAKRIEQETPNTVPEESITNVQQEKDEEKPLTVVEEKPERIKIFYGDEIDLKDVNATENNQSNADKNSQQNKK